MDSETALRPHHLVTHISLDLATDGVGDGEVESCREDDGVIRSVVGKRGCSVVVEEETIGGRKRAKVLKDVEEDRQDVERSAIRALASSYDRRVHAIGEGVRAADSLRGEDDAAEEVIDGTIPDSRTGANVDLDAQDAAEGHIGRRGRRYGEHSAVVGSGAHRPRRRAILTVVADEGRLAAGGAGCTGSDRSPTVGVAPESGATIFGAHGFAGTERFGCAVLDPGRPCLAVEKGGRCTFEVPGVLAIAVRHLDHHVWGEESSLV